MAAKKLPKVVTSSPIGFSKDFVKPFIEFHMADIINNMLSYIQNVGQRSQTEVCAIRYNRNCKMKTVKDNKGFYPAFKRGSPADNIHRLFSGRIFEPRLD
jgi:hypothetical protein